MASRQLWLIFSAGILTAARIALGDTNILTNPGFESGITGWQARSCTISASNTPVRTGNYSGCSKNRTAAWQGIQQSVLNKMAIGKTYQISGYVRISAPSDTVKVSVQKTVDGVTSYTNVGVVTANNSDWTYVSGSYTLNAAGTLTELLVYFEGPASGVKLYVDDAVVYGPDGSQADPIASGQIDIGVRHQLIEGFGAAGAWYEGTLVALGRSNPNIYNILFRDLGLDIYRLRNAYDQNGGADYMSRSGQIIAAGEAALGRPLKTLISCWSPPAYLKSNGDTANGGTLIGGPSHYAYSQLADWWADSVSAWAAYGVNADYISIQNEPDWSADWDTCRYEGTETASYAGYNLAFEAVWQELNMRMGSTMPKMLAGESAGLLGSPKYLDALLNLSHVYGYAHHLYNIAAGDNPDQYLAQMQLFNATYGNKPLFQTEYEKATGSWPDAYNMALLLHNSLTVEQVSAYLYWDLFWGTANVGLVSITSSSYTINSDYWGFKQFSAFIHSGWQRVAAGTDSSSLRISAYISPDNENLTVVAINTSDSVNIMLNPVFSGFTCTGGLIWRTSQTENCINTGSYAGGSISVPAKSIVTAALTGFSGLPRTLTISSTAGGSVTTPGEGLFSCGDGTIVPLEAAAQASYRFVQWSGTAVAAGKVADPFSADTTVTADADYTVIANFEEDLIPPMPKPDWVTAPTAAGSTRIIMSVSACEDDNPPVEYLFECTTDPTAGSGWQTSPSYTAVGLSPSTLYTFRVKARDSAAGQNETEWTSEKSATTEPPGEQVEIVGYWLSGLKHAVEDGELRLLVFTAHAERTNGEVSLAAVTYGGQAMTRINEEAMVYNPTSSQVYAASFYLDEEGIAAANGNTFVPTWTQDPSSAGYSSVFLENVDQAAPIGAKETNKSTNQTVATGPLPTDPGDLVMVAGVCGNQGDYTVNNGFTKGTELTIPSADGVVGHKTATGEPETPSLTHSNVNRQAILGFVIQAAAYKWLYGDFTKDGIVDLADLQEFAGFWLTEDCGPADVDGDCWINLEELAEFARNWKW